MAGPLLVLFSSSPLSQGPSGAPPPAETGPAKLGLAEEPRRGPTRSPHKTVERIEKVQSMVGPYSKICIKRGPDTKIGYGAYLSEVLLASLLASHLRHRSLLNWLW